ADTTGVDSLGRDVIRFAAPHHLQNGGAVIYENNDNDGDTADKDNPPDNDNANISSAINTTSPFYVRGMDPFTIKLYTSQADALAPPMTPVHTGDVSGGFITTGAGTFTNGEAVTYLAPTPVGFQSLLVNVDVDASGNIATTNGI